MSTLTCVCGEPADTIVAGRPWCAHEAFELFGPPLEEIARDRLPEAEDVRLAVVECGRCGGWMWAGLQDTCLGCGSPDLRAVALV
jgi:hypothetical protein